MNRFYYIIGILCTMIVVACQEDEVTNDTPDMSEIVELATIRTSISGDNEMQTRADDVDYTYLTQDHIGRYNDLELNDKMVFTKIERTENPISSFSYTGVGYVMTSQGAWTRDGDKKGQTKEAPPRVPDKIYWSDAAKPHTFVGYSCPNVSGFDWNKSESGVYYGSLGDPTVTSVADGNGGSTPAIIDYNNTETGNSLIKEDDMLVTWADDKVADNAVANIVYHHALALVRVIVNISGFSPGTTYHDSKTQVYNMVLKDMRTMYKWNQSNNAAEALVAEDQSILNGLDYTTKPAWNQTKDTHLWLIRPAGEGTGTGNTFLFYGLAVPRESVSGQQLSFKVRYPDPMHPDETDVTKWPEHTYAGTMTDAIKFRAGYCTTLNITLDHKDEKMTIGAEYMEWQFKATPDEGSLKKNANFLLHTDYEKATIALGSSNGSVTGNDVTIDNATWLFKGKNGVIYDKYEHTGTESDPYVIKTAAQLASFAKEVNNGRSFVGQYIKLDANLYLQEETTTSSISWPGIGDDTHPFNGTLIGGTRSVKRLKGKPFFGTLGPKAHIEQLWLEDVLDITEGGAAFVNHNQGILCACTVASTTHDNNGNSGTFNIEATTPPSGSGTTETVAGPLVGYNEGVVMTCHSQGLYSTNAKRAGGLIGYNKGAIFVSYASVKATSSASAPFYRGIVAYNEYAPTTLPEGKASNEYGHIVYNFFDKSIANNVKDENTLAEVHGKTTIEMQSGSFIGTRYTSTNPATGITEDVLLSTLNGSIYYSTHHLEQWPKVMANVYSETELQALATHCLDNRYYEHRVAKYPWVY